MTFIWFNCAFLSATYLVLLRPLLCHAHKTFTKLCKKHTKGVGFLQLFLFFSFRLFKFFSNHVTFKQHNLPTTGLEPVHMSLHYTHLGNLPGMPKLGSNPGILPRPLKGSIIMPPPPLRGSRSARPTEKGFPGSALWGGKEKSRSYMRRSRNNIKEKKTTLHYP